MADEQSGDQGAGAGNRDQGAGNGELGEKTIPYARFKEVNDQRVALEARVRELETTAAASSATHEAALKEIGDKLSAADEARLAATEARLAAEQLRSAAETRAQRLEVAALKGLPLMLADRLQGEKREELEADADRILPLLKIGNPGVPVPEGRPPAQVKLSEMSPAQIREAYDKGLLK